MPSVRGIVRGPAAIRPAAVAGSFYPADPGRLRGLVAALIEQADRGADDTTGASAATRTALRGCLVPHAGLAFSGRVAAAGWRLAGAGRAGMPARPSPTTVVLLGTNHGAAWLNGIGVWETGAWRTPLGDIPVDEDLAATIAGLGPPFVVDRAAHLGEHSIEVQLPFLQAVLPEASVVPLTVAAGTGPAAVAAGQALGGLLAGRRPAQGRLLLAISSDMAHYPRAADCARATGDLLRAILSVDAAALARGERAVVAQGAPGLVCGMCGIEPTVVGLATLRAMGVTRGIHLADATSADAGGPADRTVGYLAVAFVP